MIKVRDAVAGDAEIVARIRYEASKVAFAAYVSADTLERCTTVGEYQKIFVQSLGFGKLHFLIGERHGVPEGMLSWRYDEDKMDLGEIVSLHTLRESWGTGLGTALMDASLERIKKAGMTGVYLWTFEKNSRARRFYEKHGFVADGTRKISRYDGAVELRYTKMLDG